MDKEKLSTSLVESVIDCNDEIIKKIESVVKIINKRMSKCAHYGYTTFLIQFTRNNNIIPIDKEKTMSLIIDNDEKSTIATSIILATPNDVIKYKFREYIKDYYQKEGLNVSDRYNNDDTIIISWNKEVLNHYGYEF